MINQEVLKEKTGFFSKHPFWFWAFAIATILLSSLPYGIGQLELEPGEQYFGFHTNIDDQMVYAAWIKQSEEGKFFFENRFTTDEQPGLTVHLYFWVLGKVASFSDIPIAMHVGKSVFTLFFLMALLGLARRVSSDEFTQKLMVVVATVGTGLGWVFWQRYGNTSPIDVWQPEVFVFPSVMTNTLFAVSLFLIVFIWNCILDARDSWKPSLYGFIGVFLLTNIHTYDVLTIALVSVAFLVSCLFSRSFTKQWLVRCLFIACGGILPLIWFVHVRANDPVFAARAETLTYSPSITQIILGLGVMFALGLLSALFFTKKNQNKSKPLMHILSFISLVSIAVLFTFATRQFQGEGFLFETYLWILLFLVGIVFAVSLNIKNPATALIVCWMVIGVIAAYYPGLFQRKLMMGLSIPFAFLTALLLAQGLKKITLPDLRRVASFAVILFFSITNFYWIEREVKMFKENISNTTMHPVYLDMILTEVYDYLRHHTNPGEVVLCVPGASVQTNKDSYELVIPDLNPIITGMLGLKTYAGHWSETPSYVQKRNELVNAIFSANSNPDTVNALVEKTSAKYIIYPMYEVAGVYNSKGPEDVIPGWKHVAGDGSLALYLNPQFIE